MEVKSSDEQNMLLVQENGDDKMKAVTGLDKDGKPKTIAPKKENEPEFLKLDKHGNVLDNFMANYLRQAKEPTRFGFFKVPVENVESNAQILSDMSQNGDAGKEFLKGYQVDTSQFSAAQEQAPETKEQSQTQQPTNKEYQAIDESRIDWKQLESLGVNRENLVKTNSLDAMLNWRKSPVLIPISPKFDGIAIYTQARLSFKEGEDGKLKVAVHAIQKSPELDRPYFGVSFSGEDKKNLQNNGNLGRLVDLKIPQLEEPIRAFVSIDKLTNELVALKADKVRIPNEIKGVPLSEEQKKTLSEGKPLYLEGMTAKTGKTFSASLQVNADKKGIEFQFGELPKQSNEQNQQTKNTQTQKADGVKIPTKLGEVELTKQEQSTLKEGGVVHVQGMIDKKGQSYNAYVQVNNQKGKLDFFKWNPQKKQGVTPDANAKTQVAVNSEGKTNEATKHTNEPMKKEQKQPKEFQKNNKGMKI